jgi:hypothetical protein
MCARGGEWMSSGDETRVTRKDGTKGRKHKSPAKIERVSTQIQQRHLLKGMCKAKRLLGKI